MTNIDSGVCIEFSKLPHCTERNRAVTNTVQRIVIGAKTIGMIRTGKLEARQLFIFNFKGTPS
jgi:hypothetical protein